MEVFWARGYDGAQLVDLTKAAGIAPPSFYAAFGSKDAAFREAVDHYIATVGQVPMQALEQAPALRDGLRALLAASIDVALSQRPGGCMLLLGIVNGLPGSDAARHHLMQARRKTRELLTARIVRARDAGELPADKDAGQVAAFFHGMMQAISFQARDGASRAELASLVEPALRSLD